ncbi:hypothetical protein HYPSUDRAFT_48657 [Hypholoma sublateritium FD-334 SS-4]|uniref:Uncharacterized protein n=1 Tax=Hypholoma sublateritium (strain FD-334 SS-4) TaxID=945553 RepID=A0A0D2P3P1_HYPSF|nr:hypothetical protein HYPSUDRAFT_48657 [Hypholoma sublateritium FD-334 SS-4]
MVPSLQLVLDNAAAASALPTEIRHEIVSFSPTNQLLASWALVDKTFGDIAEKVLYSTIKLDGQSGTTMTCLQTLRSNSCKAALVKSMGIVFSEPADLLPLDLLEVLEFVIQNTSNIRHLDLDWICPTDMDDPGLTAVNRILTTPSLSLTTLHCGAEVDLAGIVKHNQSLELLGIHHAHVEDDELLFSFREMFSLKENPGDRRTRLQPYRPGTTGDEEKRSMLPHIFILSTSGESRETLGRGITIFPGLYPTILDGMVQQINDHLTSPRVNNTLPTPDFVQNIKFATVCWLELPALPATRKFFAELQSIFPSITTLAVNLKGDVTIRHLTQLSDSICVMTQLECIKLQKWENTDLTEFHASVETRIHFITHWRPKFPRLTAMYAFDNFTMKLMLGVWMVHQ